MHHIAPQFKYFSVFHRKTPSFLLGLKERPWLRLGPWLSYRRALSSKMGGPTWVIVGGADKGGILVRQGKELASEAASERVSTGAEVEQLELIGDRLHYRLISGTGPKEGWVSIKISGKELAAPKVQSSENLAEEPSKKASPVLPIALKERKVVGPGSGYRHRWAVNIEDWKPLGEHEGLEFKFLLSLIREEEDQKAVLKFKFFDDKKRALLSRLLVRRSSSSALNMTNFDHVTIKRTKGRKPFLAAPLTPKDEAPNWNVNCSHEGSWVVCASEPTCVAGIDVAELRRTKKNSEPIDFHNVFQEHLTQKEWDYVNSHGPDLDDQYEAFSRFWSAKEAFVKARGDGIAYPLGQAEFHWKPLEGFPAKTAFEGSVTIEGKPSETWRFVQYRMPGEPAHWTTVGRGPLTDIIDAHGEFKQTLRKPHADFSKDEWKECLVEESPHFDVIPVGALVPEDHMDSFVKAGGKRWP
eukprot:TRINITY_DN5690_c0_g1_i1.p1 TRINITY_DN5690_c0_g1~~TRINITY_DN5690_c0_g1_i1.p1  ORF type:complete len:468 (+),score=90.51 TRINITY_DN5690_c0_g1_i1:46-1449(+)